MNVKIELVKKYVASRICDYMDDIIEFDANEIINTKAIEILEQSGYALFVHVRFRLWAENFARTI